MSAGTVTWLLCDYGEVLSLAQPDEDRARVEEAAGRGGDRFWADYWAHRPGYDRGDVGVAGYWASPSGAGARDINHPASSGLGVVVSPPGTS